MSSKIANADTPSDTYTREAPDKINHFRVRAMVTPAKWINFAVTANDYSGEERRSAGEPPRNTTMTSALAAQFIPTEKLSLDFNFAHDDVFSQTDLCYLYTPRATRRFQLGPQMPEPACRTQTIRHWRSSNLLSGQWLLRCAVNFLLRMPSIASPSKYFEFNGGARS